MFRLQLLLEDWLITKGYNSTEILERVSTGEKAMQSTMDLLHNQVDIWQLVSTIDFKLWSSTIQRIGGVFFGSAFSVFAVFSTVSVSFYNLVIGFLVFVASLYYLLQSEEFFLDKLVELLPMEQENKARVSETIQKSINRIFLCSLLLCLSHAGVTYAIFTLFNLEFAYSASFITAFTAIFPVLSSWIVFIPAVFVLFLQHDPNLMYYSIAMLCSQVLLYFTDPLIYDMIPNSHPYITGMAVVLGISTFGLEGVLVGPLLIVFTITAYDVFHWSIKGPENLKKKKRSLTDSVYDE